MKFSRDKKIIALLLLVFHFFLFAGLYLEGLEPVSHNKNALPQIVEITKGENLFSIANKLKEKGIIRSKFVFIIEALRSGKYKEFKAGEYAFYPYQTLKEIFEILVKGKVYLHKITVFEGATLWQIAEILEKEQICSKKEFLDLAKNEEFVKSLGLPGPTVEGFLYPETYFFQKNTPPAEVIKVMTDKFKEVWKELEPLTAKSPLSLKEIVILASIVEKEAFFNEEKPKISAVYLNRIKKGMPLQADPTINYALKQFRRLTYKDYYSVKSPYNTYLNSGLPPTPIGNPSKSSLLAVLKPAKVPYLYFVADGKGGHIFSRTYKEHLIAIRKVRANQYKEGESELSKKSLIESESTSEKVIFHEEQAKSDKEIKSL
ncbi:MAG: endolytic transglycosylase MltG [Caldimicrobium sp.]